MHACSFSVNKQQTPKFQWALNYVYLYLCWRDCSKTEAYFYQYEKKSRPQALKQTMREQKGVQVTSVGERTMNMQHTVYRKYEQCLQHKELVLHVD